MSVKKSEIQKIPKLPHGEGSISYINDKNIFVYAKGYKGKRYYVYGETIKEVMQGMNDKIAEVEKGIKEKSVESLSQALYKWLIETKKNTIKPTSYDRLESTVKNQIDKYTIGGLQYQQINHSDIQIHINNLIDLDYSFSIIKKTYDLLNAFYTYKFACKEINFNPMQFVTLPSKINVKKAKDIPYLNKKEISIFIQEADKTNYYLGQIFIFDIFTGLRPGELLALRWCDIDFDNKIITVAKTLEIVKNRQYDTSNPEKMAAKKINKTVAVEYIPKTHKTRRIPLIPQAEKALLKHKSITNYNRNTDYICATSTGHYNTLSNMQKQLRRILSSANIDKSICNMYMLRHTCASLLFETGEPVEIIASILGHSVDVCRSVYIHFEDGQKVKALNKAIHKIDIDV